MTKRFMIFGEHRAVALYVREHKLSPQEWTWGAERERVIGLNPNDFETVIVGPQLDEDATAALREWQIRRVMRSVPTSAGESK